MKGKINPDLEIGDEIVLYHMEGESSLSPGTKGVVLNIDRDPFEPDGKIIYVKWENGSSLSLLSSSDIWKKAASEMNENRQYEFFRQNPDIFECFDYKFFAKYLEKIRESGILNMFTVSPLLYSGREHIDRYYGENPPNEDAFSEVLEMADVSKDKMIQGTLKCMENKNEDIDMDVFNSKIKKNANKILEMFIHFMH